MRLQSIRSQEIFTHPTTKAFIRASKESAKYFKADCPAPSDIDIRYQLALNTYCSYLDSKGIHAPRRAIK